MNLTAKEKARDLVEGFYSKRVVDFRAAKECAILHCDLLIESNLLATQHKRHYINGVEPHPHHLEYYQQVKEEISKL